MLLTKADVRKSKQKKTKQKSWVHLRDWPQNHVWFVDCFDAGIKQQKQERTRYVIIHRINFPGNPLPLIHYINPAY